MGPFSPARTLYGPSPIPTDDRLGMATTIAALTQVPSASLESSVRVASFVAGHKVGRQGFEDLAPFYEEAVQKFML